ncbi:VC0807 family protein [Streptomyces sp. NPDC002012]|uniref:VC0807 family protein n=1 Tax=Streptomyces sp. NPDC002012 TaxID=3154532 RepID=UPI003332F145
MKPALQAQEGPEPEPITLPENDEQPERTGRSPRTALIEAAALDIALPLLLFYGLRLMGVNQWLALVLSSVLPVVRMVYRLIKDRRVERPTLFSLSIVLSASLVSLLTGDPRLVLARESYLTALVGLWMLSTLLASRPFIYQATMPLLPEATSAAWREDWENVPEFRRAMRVLTIAWGTAFMIDAVARVVMAYTLPVDSVPLLGAGLLTLLLIVIVQFSKAYGKRLSTRLGRHAES